MTTKKNSIKHIARLLLMGGLIANVAILASGCGSSEDGAMLSDDEKLKQAAKGREAYGSGMRDKQSTPSTTAGQGSGR